LVRLERHQAEFWVFQAMQMACKTLMSRLTARQLDPWKHSKGIYAELLESWLSVLPPHLWSDTRRKRTYLNGVLARAEVSSAYQPSRQLWVRASNGHYFPNPDMRVRAPHTAGGTEGVQWQAMGRAFRLDWLQQGSHMAPYGEVSAHLFNWHTESDLTQDV
jgi:hypothetical protein